MGPSGTGTTMKLALNLPMAIFWAGLSEAMAMGRQFGLSIEQMLDIYLDKWIDFIIAQLHVIGRLQFFN